MRAQEGAEGGDLLEKKKKKKKKVEDDEPAALEEDAPVELELGKKKKKKKEVVADDEDEDGEDGGAHQGDGGDGADHGRHSSSLQEPWFGTDRDYTYSELTSRIFRVLEMNNPEFGEKSKIVMKQPQVSMSGTKKTLFANFMDICKAMHRNSEHFLSFLLAELGTEGSLDGNQRLLLKGRFQVKSVENIMKRYVTEYVLCHTCKSLESTLVKENRLVFVQCDTCGARRCVDTISKGFQAQVGRRKKA